MHVGEGGMDDDGGQNVNARVDPGCNVGGEQDLRGAKSEGRRARSEATR